MTTIAIGSRARLAYIAEATYGTTPATPAFKILNPTKHNIGLEKESFQSATIRSDRQIVDAQHGVRNVTGDIGFEFRHTSLDDMLEAVMMGAWASDVLKAGTTRRSFTIERYFADIGRYRRATGCEVNTLKLDCPASGIATGSFGIVGSNDVGAASAIASSTYADDPNEVVMDTITGAITVNGAAVATLTQISLSLENGIENKPVIGTDIRIRGAAGRSNCSGELTAYYDADTLLDLFENETEFAIHLVLNHGTKSYTFDLPRCKFTGGKPDVGGEKEISITLPFQALYSDSDATQLKITRDLT